VTVNIESHPDYNRVVHATCAGDEPRGEIGIEGTKAEPEAVALHGDVPEWIEPNPAEHRYSRDSLRLRPPINKYQDPEQRGEHGKPYPVTTMRHNPLTQTRQHRDTGGIDSDTDIDTDYDTDSGTTYRTAESEVLA